MDACGCDGYSTVFDARRAERDRQRYRRNGPERTTRMLLELVKGGGVAGATLLDIGGGVGVVAHELLAAGAGHAVLIDASGPALRAARGLARERNALDRLELVEGDFVRHAANFDAADIVTLDRVVCCYPDFERLVAASASRARRRYGLVVPRERWLVKLAIGVVALKHRLLRHRFRPFVHPIRRIDEIVAAEGLTPIAETGTFMWRVAVFRRV